MSDWCGFYPMHRRQHSAHESSRLKRNTNSPGLLLLSNRNNDTRYKVLELRIKFLLDKYAGDNPTREKILGELDQYRVAVAVDRACGDKKAIIARTKNLQKFLNQF